MKYLLMLVVLLSLFGCGKGVDQMVLKNAIEEHVKTYVDNRKAMPINKDLITGFKINKYKYKILKENIDGDVRIILIEYVCEVTTFRKNKEEIGYNGGEIKFSIMRNDVKYELKEASHYSKDYFFQD